MSVASALARGRAAATALMVDACAITRTGPVQTNRLDGTVAGNPVTVYSGQCRIQQALAQGQRVEAGELEPVLLRLEVQLPVVGTEGIERGDLVLITTATNDADLTARTFRVRDLHHKTHATSRRIQCEEVT